MDINKINIEKYNKIKSQFLDESLQKWRDAVEYSRRSYNVDKKNGWLNLSIDLFTYAWYLLVKNEIAVAKHLFREGTGLLISDGKPRADIPERFMEKFVTPLFIYLGQGREYSAAYAQHTISAIENDEITSRNAYRNYQKLFLWFLINDREKQNYFIDQFQLKYNKVQFNERGLPISNTLSAIANAYATYGTLMIKAIIEHEKEQFEKNCDLYSQLGMQRLIPTSGAKYLVDIELIVLFDLANGERLHPNINSIFIPERILETGYWYRP